MLGYNNASKVLNEKVSHLGSLFLLPNGYIIKGFSTRMKLQEILEQTIPGLGYELVDVEISPTKTIRIFIDKDGGVNIDDCEKVSNHLGNVLLAETIDYNRLEISSPGLDRPLRKLQDFIKFTGKLVKIKTREIIGDQKVFQGIIQAINDNEITIEIDKDNLIKIDFDNIYRARLVFELQKKPPTHKKYT